MAIANTTIKIKKSLVSGVSPSSLSNGEIAINQADGKLFYATPSGSISYITNSQSFATINANSSLILATSASDTLSIIPGTNISISACTVNKSITINSVDGNLTSWLSSNVSLQSGINSTQNTNITTATNLAQGAYNTANTAYNSLSNYLPLTGGSLSGALNANTITVSNNSIVTNLNADYLDGQHGSYYSNASNMTAGTLPVSRGGTGVTISTGTGAVVLNTSPTFTGLTTSSLTLNSTKIALGSGTAVANTSSPATVAIGQIAGNDNQGGGAVAIGYSAGNLNQGTSSVGIGNSAGSSSQGSYGIAIGDNTAAWAQGSGAIALGQYAGQYSQRNYAVAIGSYAGQYGQGNNSIAIGSSAGTTANSIAIGAYASATATNSIILNASGLFLGSSSSGFYVNPVRNDTASKTNLVAYNVTTKELTYFDGSTKYLPLTGGSLSGTLTINSNLIVTGNTTLSGNVTTVNANNLSLQDNMFYLNAGNYVTNPDLGFAGNYNDGTYHHAGFFRDASDGVWKVFDNYLPEPDASPYIDTSNNTFRIADFQANNVTFGKITTSSSDLVSNLNADYLDGQHGSYYSSVTYAQSIYDAANSSYSLAQSAYNEANNKTIPGSGALSVSVSSTVGNTNTSISWANSSGFNANSSSNYTYDLKVGPALTNLVTTLSSPVSGLLKKSDTDSYVVDTTRYLKANDGYAYSLRLDEYSKLRTAILNSTSTYSYGTNYTSSTLSSNGTLTISGADSSLDTALYSNTQQGYSITAYSSNPPATITSANVTSGVIQTTGTAVGDLSSFTITGFVNYTWYEAVLNSSTNTMEDVFGYGTPVQLQNLQVNDTFYVRLFGASAPYNVPLLCTVTSPWNGYSISYSSTETPTSGNWTISRVYVNSGSKTYQKSNYNYEATLTSDGKITFSIFASTIISDLFRINNGKTITTSTGGSFVINSYWDGNKISVINTTGASLSNVSSISFSNFTFSDKTIVHEGNIGTYTQSIYDAANSANTLAQSAYNKANTAASTGKAIAMAMVFG